MVVMLAAYVAVHSPALGVVARLADLPARRCYFTCSGWIAGGRAADVAAALLLLVTATLAGWIIACRIRVRSYERPLIFGLAALAFAVVPAAILGVVGWAAGAPMLRPPAGPALAALPALLVTIVALARGWRPVLPARPAVRFSGLELVLAVVAGVLLATLVAVTLGHPPTGYDALSYHGPMAVYFWRDGDIGAFLDRMPWAWALAHPGTAELWFGLLRIAGGERIASLGQLPFALAGAAAVYAFARRSGLGRGASRLGALGFLIAPIVVLQAGSQVNDLTAGALLMIAMALTAAPAEEWNVDRCIAIGLALGLAATTKLAALPAVGAIGLYAVVVAVGRRAGSVKLLGAMLAVGTLVVTPWWARNFVMFGNPIYPAALPLIGRGYVVGDFVKKDGWFVPSPLAWPLYPLVEPHNEMSGLGALFAVAALGGLIIAITRARRRRPLRLYGLVAAVSIPAWWTLSQHEPRLLLGVLGVGFAFVGWALLAVPRSRREVAARVCAFAALFSALVTADQALRPLAREPNDRAVFYDHVWGVDSVVAGLPEQQGLLYHTGHARLSYAGDYPLLGPSLGRQLVVIDGIVSADSVAAVMRATGVRHAYVPVAPDAGPAVAAMYPPTWFDLVHQSTVETGKLRGVQRSLFRLREP